jgi:outer membrane protein assembly factor BamD (BamD/ComL family)
MPGDFPENRRHYQNILNELPADQHEEENLVQHALQHARKGDAQHVLDVVDEFW